METPLISDITIVPNLIENLKYGILEKDFKRKLRNAKNYTNIVIEKLANFNSEEQYRFIAFQLERSKKPKDWLEQLRHRLIYDESLISTVEAQILWEISFKDIENVIEKVEAKFKVNEKRGIISFKIANRDRQIVMNLFKQVHLKIGLIKEEKCSMDDFFSVLFAKDTRTIKKLIFLSIDNTDLKYLLIKIKPRFKNITPATIGKTLLFRTNQEETIVNQANLNSSKSRAGKPKNSDIIDQILLDLKII